MTMNTEQRIPVVIGVTGHRELDPDQIPSLYEAVRTEIHRIKVLCPSSPVMILSGLAEGADQICALAGLEEGCLLAAALPMPLNEYKKDFSGKALETLLKLCDRAQELFVVPESEPHAEGRDYLYRQEGIYVAGHCHVLLALWDGKEGTAGGCGTAETVAFRRQPSLRFCSGGHLESPDRPLIWIRVRRQGSGPGMPGLPEIRRLNEENLLSGLDALDDFNREAGKTAVNHPERSGTQEDPDRDPDRKFGETAAIYDQADRLSIINAAAHKRVLASLSIAATILTMAFLLYDEMSLHWMILVCIFMLISLFMINHTADRLSFHRRFIEYRLLAEGVRVQRFLLRAGIRAEAAHLLPWAWQLNVPWIKDALLAMMIGIGPEEHEGQAVEGAERIHADVVKKIWLDDQKIYHQKALEKLGRINRNNDLMIRISLVITVLSYIAGLIFEIIWGGLFTGIRLLSPDALELVRTFLKILMGSLSAITLFASNYYGKLSLDETIADHRRMTALYEAAEDVTEREGMSEELLIRLAGEELDENSSWYAYQSTNRPEIGL